MCTARPKNEPSCNPPSSDKHIFPARLSSELQSAKAKPHQPFFFRAQLAGEAGSPWSFAMEQEQLHSLLQMDGEWKVRIILSDFALALMRRQAV